MNAGGTLHPEDRVRIVAILAEELLEDTTPLSEFSLQSREGREAFLERLVAIGEPGVFMAVAHVWASLDIPKTARCIEMGLAAGTGGVGRSALRKVLTAFVREWLGSEMTPLPKRAAYETLDMWHQAVMQTWQSEHAREQWVLQKYAAILNGEHPTSK